MKKVLWSLWFGLMSVGLSVFWGLSVVGSASVIGKLQAPGRKVPLAVTLLYQGQVLCAVDNTWVVKHVGSYATFSIVITAEVMACKDAHSPRPHVCRVPGAPVRWYDCTLMINEEQRWEWRVRELNEAEMPHQLPRHACVVLLDPELVEGLVPPTRVHYMLGNALKGNGEAIELPWIRLYPHIDEAVLTAALDRSHCGLVGIRHVHALHVHALHVHGL